MYERSIKRDKEKEMVFRGFIEKPGKVRRIVPAVKLTAIKNFAVNDESRTTFGQSFTISGMSTRNPTPRRDFKEKSNFIISSRNNQSPMQYKRDQNNTV